MASHEFSLMVKNKSLRNTFIDHAISFLRLHEFDGLDLGSLFFLILKYTVNPRYNL